MHRTLTLLACLLVACSQGLVDNDPAIEPNPISTPTSPQEIATGSVAPQAPTASPIGVEASEGHPPSPADACPAAFRCDDGALHRHPTPTITSILVEKGVHRLHLVADDLVVKTYRVAIGWGGAGPKQREGDGVTPVGEYQITGRLATSPWHTLLGVSYPNYEDVKRHARLKAEGKIPYDAGIGFGIAVHGRRADMKDGEHKNIDWTLGCVALDNDEIDEVARFVKKGTRIKIVD